MATNRGKVTEVKDLGLAAALVSLEFGITQTVRDKSGRIYFCFESTPELEESIEKYWSNNLSVKARYYSDSLKMLKSRIYGDW